MTEQEMQAKIEKDLEEFEQEIQKRNVQEKFIMIARQTAERIPELLAACDAAFLSFQNDDVLLLCLFLVFVRYHHN